MKARIAGVSLIGPGLPDWPAARAVLAGTQDWTGGPAPLAVPAVLSPRERRRTSPVVRLALNAGVAACEDAGVAPHSLDCVFASAVGDGSVTDAILSALSGPDKLVSPTRFHNSVHNAAAGYWSQGVGSHAPSTSLAAGDATFGAGLLKALLTTATAGRPVLLVASDHPFPAPLAEARPIAAPFAVGLVLLPDDAAPGPRLSLDGATGAPVTPPRCTALHDLWRGSPPARALPVLEGLIAPAACVVAAGSDYRLAVTVTP